MRHTWRRQLWAGAALLVLVGCGSKKAADVKEIESHRAQDMTISLLSEAAELNQGENRFLISFRKTDGGKPVDAGSVMVSASMAMPGMSPMTAPIELQPSGETGKYAIHGNFAMSGAWRFEVRWNGPAGQGSTTFTSNVR